MAGTAFTVEIDGRTVVVDPAQQEVAILDDGGNEVFRGRIQVAAGSIQGLFELDSQHYADRGTDPFRIA